MVPESPCRLAAERVRSSDRKGELWHITADHRKTFSHVFYFAPTDPATVRWNPLFEVRKGLMEIADIQNVVGILVDPLGRKAGDLEFLGPERDGLLHRP